MERRNESEINDVVMPVPIWKTEIILHQMKNCVCQISNEQKMGTGFFAGIIDLVRFRFSKVLITTSRVLGKNDILPGKIITLHINGGEVKKTIKIDSNRITYTSKEHYGITIIELNKNDNINNYLMFDVGFINKINLNEEEIINNNNSYNNQFKKESIYLLNYIPGEDIFVSYGILDNINKDQINYKCHTQQGSAGSPILLLRNNMVIGVHMGAYGCTYNKKFGKLLIKSLKKYFQIYEDHLKEMNINKIYNDIMNYFKNERDIEQKLNNKITQGQIYNGFLVDKKWVENWKRNSHYDYIKNNFLNKNINDDNSIKNYLKDKQNNKLLNYKETNDVDNYILNDINQLKIPENQNKAFVLLNLGFLSQFPIKSKIASIPFYLSNQNIQIRTQNIPIISFQTNNNVIINKGNNISLNNVQMNHINAQEKNIYDSEFLKHILRNIYLKKELFSQNNIFQNKINQAYIINSSLINKLKQIYNLKDIIAYLDNNQLLSGLTYNNFDDNYPRISKFLNEKQTNYINIIKKTNQKE